jgi:hypothetical protein
VPTLGTDGFYCPPGDFPKVIERAAHLVERPVVEGGEFAIVRRDFYAVCGAGDAAARAVTRTNPSTR